MPLLNSSAYARRFPPDFHYPRYPEREELLGLINEIVDWKLGKLHILATSRREKDIEETLEPLITRQICIQRMLVDAEIHIYLRESFRMTRD